MMTKEAMKLALEALDGLYMPGELDRANKAITALREALASEAIEQPAQPAREFVGLTDEDKAEIKKQANYNWETTTGEYASKVQALTEAKLKEKNT